MRRIFFHPERYLREGRGVSCELVVVGVVVVVVVVVVLGRERSEQ